MCETSPFLLLYYTGGMSGDEGWRKWLDRWLALLMTDSSQQQQQQEERKRDERAAERDHDVFPLCYDDNGLGWSIYLPGITHSCTHTRHCLSFMHTCSGCMDGCGLIMRASIRLTSSYYNNNTLFGPSVNNKLFRSIDSNEETD